MRISDWSSDVCSSDLPSLAESWTVDGNVWTFKLRPNVKFADGSPFTAEDVLFTYARVPKVPNSPSSYSLYLSTVEKVEAPDPMTVRITTKGPSPVLLANLPMVPIISPKASAAPAPDATPPAQPHPRHRHPGRAPARARPCHY